MHFKSQIYLNFCRKTLFFLVHKSLLGINVRWLSFFQKHSLCLVLNTEIFYSLVTDCIFTQKITYRRTLLFRQLTLVSSFMVSQWFRLWHIPIWLIWGAEHDTQHVFMFTLPEDTTEIYVQGRLLQVETREPRDFCCLQIVY